MKTPESPILNKSCIEDLFKPALLLTSIDGKTFDPAKEHAAPGKYGKLVFAEKVVRPNVDKIDFSAFTPLLDRILATIANHAALKSLPFPVVV